MPFVYSSFASIELGKFFLSDPSQNLVLLRLLKSIIGSILSNWISEWKQSSDAAVFFELFISFVVKNLLSEMRKACRRPALWIKCIRFLPRVARIISSSNREIGQNFWLFEVEAFLGHSIYLDKVSAPERRIESQIPQRNEIRTDGEDEGKTMPCCPCSVWLDGVGIWLFPLYTRKERKRVGMKGWWRDLVYECSFRTLLDFGEKSDRTNYLEKLPLSAEVGKKLVFLVPHSLFYLFSKFFFQMGLVWSVL